MQAIKIFLLLFLTFQFTNFLPAQSRLSFDGFGDYIALDGTDFPPPWTMECWVSKSQTAAWQHLLTSTDGTSGFRIEQYINNGRIGITSAGIADWQFSYSLNVGEWTHVAITNDGSQMKLFINGQATGGTINGSIPFPMGMVGLNTTGGGALNAKIDELRIWNTNLQAAEILDWMNEEVTDQHPFFDNLQHYYRLDEGMGNIAHDSQGSLDGEIFGATWENVFQKDGAAVALLAPLPFVSSFSANQQVKVRFANVGLNKISQDFSVAYSLDGGPPVEQTVEVTDPVLANQVIDINFPNVDLTNADIHTFKIWLTVTGDENVANDTLFATSSKSSITLSEVTDFQEDSGVFTISNGVTKIRVMFYRPDVFRVWLAPNGIFNDPLENVLAIHGGSPLADVDWSDEGDFFKMETANCELRAYKSPLSFSCFDKNGNLLWQESEPLTFGQQTRQKLSLQPDEQIYGCGMQNGYFAHRDRTVKIENVYGDWGDGTTPNPAPFFMSTNGYGAFRNTFAKGQYDFNDPAELRHNETRFDCYYFVGDLKEVLEGYTWVTGRPFMVPRWGMEFGDADCYNDTGTTMDVFHTIAKQYRNQDIPGGWILPNDGYSCGYEALPDVVDSLETLGFYTGLWTENGTDNAAYEVGEAGSRLWKLDVALVGPGYQSAFNSGLAGWDGIEQNSNARGYLWTVAGWAGTQRFATVWSGDQYGTWENIRFHIPTVIGSGLSAQNCATGDVDGIFGGSAQTYTRDLQWKCFTPVLMTISGWASVGKQPYAYGGNWTDINRKYLKLKNRLKPYLYSYCREAHETGVPSVRGMMLEFPDDPLCQGDAVKYQFMSGEHFLVAPIYESGTSRDGIYLPQGTWRDYWSGETFDGPLTIDDYDAPYEKLPLFVRNGAIIPMYPEMLHDREKPFDPLTLDVYPQGETQFEMYEDDGWSQDFRNGEFAKTMITCEAPEMIDNQPITITVGASEGDFDSKLAQRGLVFEVHFPGLPQTVLLNDQPLPRHISKTDWEAASEGWFYDHYDRGGVIFVKTLPQPTDAETVLRLEDFDLTATEEAVKLGAQISLQPNPANGEVAVTWNDELEVEMVEIFDLAGQLKMQISENLAGQSLTIERLSSGIYFVKIKTEGGEVVKKLVAR